MYMQLKMIQPKKKYDSMLKQQIILEGFMPKEINQLKKEMDPSPLHKHFYKNVEYSDS